MTPDKIPLQLIQPTEKESLTHWETTRFMHSRTPIGPKGRAIHMMTVYAEAMGPLDRLETTKHNESQLARVLTYANSLGPVPIIVGMDLDNNPQESTALTKA